MNFHERRYTDEIPGVEAAIVEYFADTAEDPRLEKLLTNSDYSQSTFHASLNSQHEIYPDVLKNDCLFDKGDHLELLTTAAVTGHFIKDGDMESMALELISDTDKEHWIRIESNKDRDYTLTLPDGTSKTISCRDLAEITLRANDDFPIDCLNSFDENPRNDDLYKVLIRNVWERTGMLSGYLDETSSIKKVAYDSERMQFIHHVLKYTRHTDIESPDTISIQYKRIIPYPELGSEEIYYLNLTYIDAGSHMQSDAQKIIRSHETDEDMKKYLLKNARISYMTQHGTVVDLDSSDPETMKIFVDSFEELLEMA